MSENLNRVISYIEDILTRVPPALIALPVQIFSLLLSLLVAIFVELRLTHVVPIFAYIFIQSAFAAVFSFLLRMDWWWCAIQFLFPILVVIFAFSKIPSHYYLAALIVFALVYWSSFRTRVPYYPSKSSLLPAILDILRTGESLKFIDVGSGLGGLPIKLSRANKKSHFFGVEIAPLPWLVSFLRGKYCKSNAYFFFGNYEKLHFGEYDVVFAYLSPAAMPALWEKAKCEMRTGTILLSYEFIIPNVKPDLCINMSSNDPTLYLWRI